MLERFRRSRRLLAVAGLALAAIVWILSGVVTRDAPVPATAHEPEPMAVAVETRQAEDIEQVLVLQGQVEPHMRTTVRAETAGQLAEWLLPLGADVRPGDVIAQLRMDDREARRQQAIANLRDKEAERAATRRLVEQGASPRIQLEASEAAVAAAEAQLRAIELEIDNTRIQAPVEGVINQRIAERGDFVSVGGGVAEIVDNDPLLGVVQVPQHQIERVERGQVARLRFLDGRGAEGEVTFVASVAQPGTRTFRVEITVPNPDLGFPSGISAGVEIPTREVRAHRVSPALISLDDAGRVGVKTVDDDDRVAFHPVQVVRTAPDGVWVTGLPDVARLITVGQGFVATGQRVRPRAADTATEGPA